MRGVSRSCRYRHKARTHLISYEYNAHYLEVSHSEFAVGGEGLTFREAVVRCLRRYVAFGGRASRSEFGYWTLFVAAVWLVIVTAWAVAGSIFYLSDRVYGGLLPAEVVLVERILDVMFSVGLLTVLPTVAAISRRLHDIGWSGWWQSLWYFGPVPLWLIAGVIGFAWLVEGFKGADPSPVPLLVIGGLALGASAGMAVWAAVMLAWPGNRSENRYGRPE